MTNNEYDALFEQRKIGILFNESGVTLGISAIVAILISATFWPMADKIISPWLIGYLGLCTLYYYLVYRYQQSKPEKKEYRYYFYSFSLISMISGVLWGGLCIYLLSISSIAFSLIIILTLCVLVAATIPTYALAMPIFFTYTIPAIFPTSVFLMLAEDPLLSLFGIVLLIFYIFIVITTVKLNKMIVKSISYQLDNLRLMDELKLKKTQILKLSDDLNTDIAKWKNIETQLTMEKQKALELAERLLAISILDGLTGILNRRNFDQELAKEWKRSERTSTPLSLIMCDIDHFKSYNDHYGHQNGDSCLIRIANTLQEHARRDGDIATRYGGEEFVIILPSTTLENATEIAEQIRLAVISLSIPHQYSETDNIVTVSIGVATLIPDRNQDSINLISLADKALYEAKQRGRNRVVHTDQEVQKDQKYTNA